MTNLSEKHCEPCEGGVNAMQPSEVKEALLELNGWQTNEHATEIVKDFAFKDFYRTMAFVNAVAWVANQENHHPDLKVGYNYCHVRYSTHAIDGLSINDFICAAKIDKILAS